MGVTVNATTAIPGAPLTISPGGLVSNMTPKYRWYASPGATSYILLGQNLNSVFFNESHTTAELGCGLATAGVCSWTPNVVLPHGTTYNWFVNGANTVGTSPWSDPPKQVTTTP